MANTFKRGAHPTPRHKLLHAMPHRQEGVNPPQVIVIPSFLEMWLNDQDGDCVTAEEAASKAAYSVANGQPETKITDDTVRTFCNKYGFLNGANLTDVMDKMISDGFEQDAGYKDGPYTGVDYSNEDLLKSALVIGPVKIGIDANALPSGAGNANGWSASGGRPGQFNNEDHCVALWGYGPSAELFKALGVAMPSGFPDSGYLLYTWSTVGVVDYAWLMSTCGEAWVRNPTTVGVTPIPIPPGPGPGPGPLPNTLQEIVDAILEGLETELAAIPFFGKTLAAQVAKLQAWIDTFFQSHPSFAKQPMKTKAGGAPTSIQPEIDMLFTMLEAVASANPVIVGILKFVQPLVDAWIVAHGW